MVDFSNENVIHVKNRNVQYIQFRRFLKYKDTITHGFTLKNLNFKDINECKEDYLKLCSELNLDFNKVIRPKQNHTDVVEIVKYGNVSEDFIDVDGLVTDVKSVALSLVYADCTALLMYDPVKNVIANVHSGWRGTVQKIGKIAVEKMVEKYNCNPKDIICCICPTIRACHFQVEEDVKEIFMKAFSDESIITDDGIADGKQKYKIDAVSANIKMLKKCGLLPENIIDSGICTVCNSDYFHSYRAHREKTGRNTAIISLK